MTSSPNTLSHSEAQLLKRNELLEELWQVDVLLREFCQNTGWRPGGVALLDREGMIDLQLRRDGLVDSLREMGAVPWNFDPDRDNSWLVTQRSGLSTGS